MADKDNEITRHIGQRIAQRRDTESHRMVAERTGMSVDKLKAIEQGRVRATLGELRTISCALSTTVSDFLPEGVRETDLE